MDYKFHRNNAIIFANLSVAILNTLLLIPIKFSPVGSVMGKYNLIVAVLLLNIIVWTGVFWILLSKYTNED